MPTAYMSLGEACERLRIPPRTFRQVMADFGDLLEAPRPSADGRLQELSVETVERIDAILQLRSRGVPIEAIRARLAAGSLDENNDLTGSAAEVAATAEAVIERPAAPETGPAETPPAAPDGIEGTAQPGTAPAVPADPATAPAVSAAPEPAPAVDAALLQRQEDLLQKLERLTQELAESEQRRVDDRDRLLTVLLRTQVEIQQLRHEMAAQASRRDRKQQSWVARWFA